MAGMTDFRRVADEVRNWGRWGDADELGTLNLITAEKVQQAASLVMHGKVFPLGVDFGSSGPQGAFHYRQNPMHVMTIDGGDARTLLEYGPKWLQNPSAVQLSGYSEAGPMRFNDDIIIMPLQAATQWDALSHVYYEDKLYNGFPAESVTSLGALYCGIDKVDGKGITSRGVLLDIVRLRGVQTFCELGDPITPAELDEAARAQTIALTQEGFYDVRRPSGRHELVAVNADRLESDLDVLPVETLTLWQNTGQGSASAAGAGEAGPGKKNSFWWYVLLAALALAVAETIVGNQHLSVDKEAA